MLRSMYTAGTAMLANSRRMDVITNNLTNVETRGFKADNLVTRSFRDMLISRINDPSVYQYKQVGTHNTGIHVDQVYTSFTPGAMDTTDVKTDLCLPQEGFFVIDYTTDEDAEQVERYTRNGAFNVDAEGYLVTGDGNRVLGEGGPLKVDDANFTVTPEGYVITSTGEELDRLRVVTFQDNEALRKEGENMFYNFDPENNPSQPADILVKQGFLENSNVDSAREMVDMMQTYRAYEINQRVLRMIDENLGRTVNDIARL